MTEFLPEADAPLLLGPYELKERIGLGGMAEVYIAEKRSPGGLVKRVALKRMRPEFVGDEPFRRLFLREAALSLSLAHPNLVQVFDFGDSDGELYLAMEYIEGTDFLGLCHDGLPAPLLAAVAYSAARALCYLHERAEGPVLHRDLSPTNILIDVHGQVKLVDVGIARPISDSVATAPLGTWRYAAPEQRAQVPLSPACDLFSLARVVLEGADSGPRGDWGNAGQTASWLAALAERPGFAGLCEVLGPCLAYEPEKRPQTARELLAPLGRLLLPDAESCRAALIESVAQARRHLSASRTPSPPRRTRPMPLTPAALTPATRPTTTKADKSPKRPAKRRWQRPALIGLLALVLFGAAGFLGYSLARHSAQSQAASAAKH